MPDILEIPEIRERVSPLTVEEYHRLGEFNANGKRTELIRGIIVEKMSKSPLHRIICARLFKVISEQLPKSFSVWKEEPLTLRDSEPEPDISVTRGGEADFTNAHPSTAELVIEVAVSSAAQDRANLPLYAEAQVTECWIVLAATKQVEVYRRPSNGRYLEANTFGKQSRLECQGLPGVTISLEQIFD